MEKSLNLAQVGKFVISLVFGLVFVAGMSIPLGPLPPLGDLLDPTGGGLWEVGTTANHPTYLEKTFGGLNATVTIYRDKMGIPHVYADTDSDLFFAMGYVQAQDRLWQLDFQKHVFSGRLSEILGDDYLETDIFLRQLGFVRTSVTNPTLTDESSGLNNALIRYANGINAYIDGLSVGDLPFEFRLLNYKPEHWTPADSLALGKLMAYQLAYDDVDLQLTVMCQKLGKSSFQDLVPLIQPYQVPIIPDYGAFVMPAGYDWRNSSATHLNSTYSVDNYFDQECPSEELVPSEAQFNLQRIRSDISYLLGFTGDSRNFIGSNNWVARGNVTDTGKPILLNDMHLSHSLPPIWYQVSLHSVESQFHWWGFSFVGTPIIVAGHNQYAAWGFTNVGADATDWYHFTQHPADPSKYYYNGSYRSYTLVNETIKVKGAGDYDLTIKETEYGPVITSNFDLVMRWTGYKNSTIIDALFHLTRAKNLTDYQNAIEFWDIPGQNVVFADVNNNIALWVTGSYPIRLNGYGRFVVNASANPDLNRWNGTISFIDMPHSINPAQNYLQSANQRSAGPLYSHYLAFAQAASYRGRRIDFLLHTESTNGNTISIDDMKRFQSDNFDSAAEAFIPYLLSAASTSLVDQYKTNTTLWNAGIAALTPWQYVMDRDLAAPLIYHQFIQNFMNLTFFDEYESKKVTIDGQRVRYPQEDILEYLTRTNNTVWFDDVATGNLNETRDHILLKAFKLTLEQLSAKYSGNVDTWKWGTFHQLLVEHIVGGSLSDTPRPWDGSGNTLNAAGSSSQGFVGGGPSERAIYDLGNWTNSRAQLPGGQSGNPLSPHYKDLLVSYWYEYEYYPQHFYLTSATFPQTEVESTLKLKPGGV